MPLPAAPTVRVGTKRTPGAGLWPGGIRRERTNDNRDRFYLKRRAAVFAAGQARSVDLPWSGRSRTGEYLSRGIGTYIGGDRLPHLICCGSNLGWHTVKCNLPRSPFERLRSPWPQAISKRWMNIL